MKNIDKNNIWQNDLAIIRFLRNSELKVHIIKLIDKLTAEMFCYKFVFYVINPENSFEQ